MNRRLTAGLTATALALSLTVPAAAQDTTPSPATDSDTTSVVETAGEAEPTEPVEPTEPAEPVEPTEPVEPAEPPAPVEEPEDEGSSFMGPRELFYELTGSTIPGFIPGGDSDADADAEKEPLNPDDYPEWMHSALFPSEEVELIFAILNAIIIVTGAMMQAAVVILPMIPGGVDQLRDALASVGIYA